MHSLAIHLFPVLAAKSKTPFYVAGGALVLWALVVSLALGLRKPDFPGGLQGQRVVSAISVLLVLAAISTAVITSQPEKSEAQAAKASAQTTEGAATPQPQQSTGATSTPSGGTPAPAPAAVTKLQLAANPSGLLSYNTKQLSAKAGKVSITLVDESPVEHNVTIAQGTKTLAATPTFVAGSRTLTLTLEPGTYTFYCSVPGHRQAGMEGTLKVS